MATVSSSSSASRPLTDIALWVARIAWLALVAVQFASFASALPHYLPLAEHPCQERCLLTIQQAQLLTQAGIPLTAYVVIALVTTLLAVLISATMAGVLFWRRSHDLMALIAAYVIVVLPTSVALMPGPTVTTYIQTTAFTLPPIGDYLINGILSGAILGLFLLFPSGRFVPRWSWAWLIGFVVFTTTNFALPDPQTALAPVWIAFFAGTAASIAYRYWRVSIPVERQQTKWVSLGFVIFMVIISAYWIPSFTAIGSTLYQPFAYIAYQLILPVVPLSFFIAIQRYRLYDIDVLIRRTLLYGSLTVILVAIYVVGVVGAQTLLTRIVGASAEQPPILIVVTTLLIAALFQPLRNFLQQAIDQRFYRTKYDVEYTLATFGAALRSDVDLDRLQVDLVTVIEETMQPEHASLWLRAAPLIHISRPQEVS
jgi:hypothetical protein